MTKTEALNKAAQGAGFPKFDKTLFKHFEKNEVELENIIHRAMDIYAGEKANEAYNQAINHVANFRTLTKEQMEQLQKLVK